MGGGGADKARTAAHFLDLPDLVLPLAQVAIEAARTSKHCARTRIVRSMRITLGLRTNHLRMRQELRPRIQTSRASRTEYGTWEA